MNAREELIREEWRPVVGYEGRYDALAAKEFHSEEIIGTTCRRVARILVNQAGGEMTDIYEEAPAGTIFVCGACGKTSPNRCGFTRDNRNIAQRGWDESCFLSAVLCKAGGPPWESASTKQEGS